MSRVLRYVPITDPPKILLRECSTPLVALLARLSGDARLIVKRFEARAVD